MFRLVCVVRLILDGRYVEDAGVGLADAYLAARLAQVGIPADLFRGGGQGRVLDVAARLSRTMASTFVIHVSQHNLAATIQLRAALRELAPSARCLLWTEDNTLAEQRDGVLFARHQDVVVAHIADWLRMPGYPQRMPAMPSPYRSGQLDASAVQQMGFKLFDPEQIGDELAWYDSLPDGVRKEAVAVEATSAGDDAIAALLAMVMRLSHLSIVLTLTREQYGRSDLALRANAKLRLVIIVERTQDALPKTDFLESRLRDAGKFPPAVYARNGAMVFYSGAYGDRQEQPALTHLQLAGGMSCSASEAALQWAAPHLALRSALVTQGASEPAEGPTLPAWPKHRYDIRLPATGRSGALFIDGDTSGGLSLQIQPYPGAPADAPRALDLVAVATPLQRDRMGDDVHAFAVDGVLRLTALPATLINNCRWSTAGRCTQHLLKRLQVDGDGALSTCLDTPPISTIAHSYEDLGRKVVQIQTQRHLERGCLRCEVRDECSRCTALPAGLDAGYCEFRRAHPMLAVFNELTMLPLLLPQVFGKAARSEWRVSMPGLPNAFLDNAPRSLPARPAHLLLSNDTGIFVWGRGTRNIAKLTAAMAFLMEGAWSPLTRAELAAAAARKFGIDSEAAAHNTEKGLAMLTEAGWL